MDERLKKVLSELIEINEALNTLTVSNETPGIVGRLIKVINRTEELTDKPIKREIPKIREFKIEDYIPLSQKELSELEVKKSEVKKSAKKRGPKPKNK